MVNLTNEGTINNAHCKSGPNVKKVLNIQFVKVPLSFNSHVLIHNFLESETDLISLICKFLKGKNVLFLFTIPKDQHKDLHIIEFIHVYKFIQLINYVVNAIAIDALKL